MNVNAIRHPVVEHDVRASGRQPLGDRTAHRATGAGDDRYLAGQRADLGGCDLACCPRHEHPI
jgi:hypothetical protein